MNQQSNGYGGGGYGHHGGSDHGKTAHGGHSAYQQPHYQRDHDYHLENGYKQRPNHGRIPVQKKYTGPSIAKELANTLRDISLQTGSGGTSQTSFSIADIEESKFIMMRGSSAVIGTVIMVAFLSPLAFWLILTSAPGDSLIGLLVAAYFLLSAPVFFHLFWTAYILRESKGFAISDVAQKFFGRYMMIWVVVEWSVVFVVAAAAIGWSWTMIADPSWLYDLAAHWPKKQEVFSAWLDGALPYAPGALFHFLAMSGVLALLYWQMSRRVLMRAERERAERKMEALISEFSNAEVAEGILDGKY